MRPDVILKRFEKPDELREMVKGRFELRAGELFHIPPEPHDSWVVGEAPYVSQPNDSMIRVCLAGASGWAGSELARGIASTTDLTLVAAVSRTHAGRTLGDVLGDARLTAGVARQVAPTATSVMSNTSTDPAGMVWYVLPP